MSANKQTILVVDDKPSNIEIIIQSFLDSEFQILAATNGEMACMLAETNQPDLIILDWHMPGMSGLEVIKKLKSQPLTKDIAVIMATAVHTDSNNLKEALDAGAHDFLRKPFDKIELQARVKSAIRFIQSQKKVQIQQKHQFEQKEKIFNDAIDQKKRELITGAMQIAKQNEMNTNLIDELIKLLPETDDKTNIALRNIINKYKVKSIDTGWLEFKARFTQVNNLFYQKLQSQFPSLTTNEIKLCSFLHLKMSNREIISITSQSTESLRKAKFRLRKKMNFNSDNELVKYLTGI